MLTTARYVEALEKRLPAPLKPPLKILVKAYRRPTASLLVLPDVLIIGSRKCGTTSLFRYLLDHPCVLPPLKKEIFYFSEHHDKGETWYRGHFPTAIERKWRAWRTGLRPLTGE